MSTTTTTRQSSKRATVSNNPHRKMTENIATETTSKNRRGRKPQGFTFLPYEAAQRKLKRMGINSLAKWQELCKSGNRPENIPAAPFLVYKEQWQGFPAFLGYKSTGRGKAKQNDEVVVHNEATPADKVMESSPQPKRRGRPKGSKNKPKDPGSPPKEVTMTPIESAKDQPRETPPTPVAKATPAPTPKKRGRQGLEMSYDRLKGILKDLGVTSKEQYMQIAQVTALPKHPEMKWRGEFKWRDVTAA